MSNRNRFSRREFLAATALGSMAAVCGAGALSCFGAERLPIVVFSKVYQTLKLNFQDAAAATAEAGLNGIDCPVRPGGEVLPERVSEDLPVYVEALKKRNLQMPLITTAITAVASPHTEAILRTARRLGIQYYRIGFMDRRVDIPVARQLTETKARLKELAALNKQIGIGALVQNHSPAGHAYLGGDLAELHELVRDFDPAQIGAAFDIGHAWIVHGPEWLPWFEKLKSHLRIAYVKDATRAGRWVPFGEGDLGKLGYFKRLKELGYQAPISLHIEYDWTRQGQDQNRPALINTLQESSRVLRHWLAQG